MIVKIKVICGVIDGKIVCSNSWTKPLVIEAELLCLMLETLPEMTQINNWWFLKSTNYTKLTK